jgi:predicted acetyltransferase
VLTSTIPYNHPMSNQLIMKSICDQSDVDRLAVFNSEIFGQRVATFAPSLILHHPATRPEHWLYVEDETTKQIVASLALIPWEWRYEEVVLKSGEVGLVGTLETHRNRGLIRALMTRHHELLQVGEFDLSHIQGIPYFYRQFGYEYAMPLDVHLNLELHCLPNEITETLYHFRLATKEDVSILSQLYEQAALGLSISAVRDESFWHYLLDHSLLTDLGAETWLVLDANQQPIAYFRLPFHGFGSGLIINETSRLDRATAEAVLVHLRGVAQQQDKTHIRLNLPNTNDLVRVARGFNAHDDGCYLWQTHLVDVARLLRKLAPVLERRIATSVFAGLTSIVCLNLYREAFELRFENGKLRSVQSIGFTNKGEIKLPPLLLAPLLLGYQSREELSRMYPDINIYPQFQHLVDVMFPKLEGFIFTIY